MKTPENEQDCRGLLSVWTAGDNASRFVRRLCCLAALLAAAAVAALPIDQQVASFFDVEPERLPIHDLVTLAEVFAHGFGVGLILVTAYVLDAPRRRRLPRVVAGVVSVGLTVDVLKLAVGRIRPRSLTIGQGWDSFVGWFATFRPELRQGLPARDCQSFPSGHAALATALAIGLTWLYPQGRWLFATFAVLAAVQRLETSAHYVSDTLAGAAIACVVCAACFGRTSIGQRFDRWERTDRD